MVRGLWVTCLLFGLLQGMSQAAATSASMLSPLSAPLASCRVSVSTDLKRDAERDLADVGCEEIDVWPQVRRRLRAVQDGAPASRLATGSAVAWAGLSWLTLAARRSMCGQTQGLLRRQRRFRGPTAHAPCPKHRAPPLIPLPETSPCLLAYIAAGQ